MPEEKFQVKKQMPRAASFAMHLWAIGWAHRVWRQAGTGIAAVLALLVMWHVVYGNHGLSIWQQKRAEDRALQHEIKDLQQENAQMRQQIDHLNSDPDAIEREAREKLHYAKPGEVIVNLSDDPQAQQTPQAR